MSAERHDDILTATHTSNVIRWRRHATPCGTVRIGVLDGRLCLCDWADVPSRDFVMRRLEEKLHARFANTDNGCGSPATGQEADTSPAAATDIELLDRAARQLDEYLAGQRRLFDIPLLTAGTPFQQAVWEHLTEIPYGETRPYAWLAARLGRPQAVRAVAAANRANALSIFLPCHRVIGSDGSLTGYAGGLPAKRLLLELERTTGTR